MQFDLPRFSSARRASKIAVLTLRFGRYANWCLFIRVINGFLSLDARTCDKILRSVLSKLIGLNLSAVQSELSLGNIFIIEMQSEPGTFSVAAIELKSLLSSGAKKSMYLLYRSDVNPSDPGPLWLLSFWIACLTSCSLKSSDLNCFFALRLICY